MLRILPLLLLITFLFNTIQATTYTYTANNGDWDEVENWSPSYPGTEIQEGDEVIIDGICFIRTGVNNKGLITIKNGAQLAVAFDSPTFINSASGEITADGQLIIIGIMYNQGKLVINDQFYIAHIFINFNEWINNALVIAAGTSLNNTGDFTNHGTMLDNTGFFNNSNATVFNDGEWTGTTNFMNTNFENNGITSPGNSSGFISEYIFSKDYTEKGMLLIEIRGNGGPGRLLDGHDRLLSWQSIDLGGTLKVEFLDGFVPSLGDSFEILSSVSGITGNFATLELPTLPNGNTWDIVYNANTVVISVIAAPLAVELGEFNIRLENQKVEIRWQSLSESNHDFYQIERSKDAQNWEALGRVKGQGNTSVSTNYLFVDQHPDKGHLYYRLVLVDFNEHKEYSATRYINIPNRSDDILLTNTFKSNKPINLQIANPEGLTSLTLYDLNGITIHSQKLNLIYNPSLTIHKNLSPGVYIISFKREGQIISERIFMF